MSIETDRNLTENNAKSNKTDQIAAQNGIIKLKSN